MSTFWKFFGIFLVIWIIWYFTGGPQRTTKTKPYVRYEYDTMQIHKSNTDLETGAKEMLPQYEATQGFEMIDYNLNNPSFTQPAQN